MSFESYAKYNDATRKPTFATINDPVVIFMGLTIEDMGVAVVTFLIFAMVLGSPFLGVVLGAVLAYARRAYAKKFPRGAIVHRLWSLGVLKKRMVPKLFEYRKQSIFSP